MQTVQKCDLKVMQSTRLEKLLRSLPWKWQPTLSAAAEINSKTAEVLVTKPEIKWNIQQWNSTRVLLYVISAPEDKI